MAAGKAWQFLVPLAAVVLGWLLGLITPSLHRRIKIWLLGPKLKYSVDENSLQPIPNGLDFYLRVGITNVKPLIAKQCRAFLVKVEEWDDKNYKPTNYRDCLPLIWSYDTALVTVDIPRGVTRHFDIVRIGRDLKEFNLCLWSGTKDRLAPTQYEHFCKRRGQFRLTVCVGADEINSLEVKTEFLWGDEWPPKIIQSQS